MCGSGEGSVPKLCLYLISFGLIDSLGIELLQVVKLQVILAVILLPPQTVALLKQRLHM